MSLAVTVLETPSNLTYFLSYLISLFFFTMHTCFRYGLFSQATDLQTSQCRNDEHGHKMDIFAPIYFCEFIFLACENKLALDIEFQCYRLDITE